MLGATNANCDEFTKDDVPGVTFGPYKSRGDLLFDFLTRCVREDIADEIIIDAVLGEETIEQVKKLTSSTGAIHNWCIKKKISRSDLEQQIKLAKAGDDGDASAPLSPP